MRYLKNIWLFIKWVSWNLWYLVPPYINNLDDYLVRCERIQWPWLKFEPYVLRNECGKMWQVVLKDDLDYCCRMTISIQADIYFSQKGGKITAIDLFDEELVKIEQQND